MSKHLASFWQWEAVITPEKCQEIIQNHFHNTEIGRYRGENENPLVGDKRKTEVAWVQPGAEIFDTIYNFIVSANQQNWNYDLSGMEDVQLGKYEDGGHYDWHSDIGSICDEGFQRKLSLSLQLTPDSEYEGGELILRDANNEEHTAFKKQGSITVFSSMLPHKVMPVTSGVRYSAVGWMRGPAFR